MIKIRRGTDILFRIEIDGKDRHKFDKSIQSIFPTIIYTFGNHHTASFPTKTATNQCSGSRNPIAEQQLRVISASIIDEQKLITDVLFLGEEQRSAGSKNMIFNWMEGNLGSRRHEQLRFTVNFDDVVELVDDIRDQNLKGTTTEYGRIIVPLRWSFDNEPIEPDPEDPPDPVSKDTFVLDITCLPSEVQAIQLEIPFFKYNKKFAYSLRNDDNGTSLWRTAHRYCIGGEMPLYVNRNEISEEALQGLTVHNKRVAPRTLGYTDGCGNVIPFSFDTAGYVTAQNGNYSWNENNAAYISRSDILRQKDFGGHFLLHDMFYAVTDDFSPAFDNDHNGTIARDVKVVETEFDYTPITFCNPNGDPFYTQPCINNPKILCLSGGGYAFRTPEQLAAGINGSTYGQRFPEAVQYYGLPSPRTYYNWDSNLSGITKEDVENTLMVSYVYNDNHPFQNKVWKQQHSYSKTGVRTFVSEVTHGLGYDYDSAGNFDPVNSALLKNDLYFFEEIHDTVGANGDDSIWFCSQDEIVEYLLYSKSATISKETTSKGCKFTIKLNVPEFMSFKTYSAIIKNLPATAKVNYNQEVTSFNMNRNTGLINFGYSKDMVERAERWVAKANELGDTQESIFYRLPAQLFVGLLGEKGLALKNSLQNASHRKPILHLPYDYYNAEDTTLNILVSNLQNAWVSVIEWIELRLNGTTDWVRYRVPTGSYQFTNRDSYPHPIIETNFDITIPETYGLQRYAIRAGNCYGVSEEKILNIFLEEEYHDPEFVPVIRKPYTRNDGVYVDITHRKYISQWCYRLIETSTQSVLHSSQWFDANVTEAFVAIPSHGEYELSFNVIGYGGTNYPMPSEYFNFTGTQQIWILANVDAGYEEGVGYVNKIDSVANSAYMIDTNGNNNSIEYVGLHYPYNTVLHDLFKSVYNITNLNASISTAYWQYPALSSTPGKYPNHFIDGDNVRKYIRPYGNVRTTTTEQMCYMFSGIPAGNYTINMLLSATDSKYLRNTVRVQNEIKNITAADAPTYIVNNNSNYITFENVIVTDNKLLLVSQYSEDLTPYSHSICAPICILEIIKN